MVYSFYLLNKVHIQIIKTSNMQSQDLYHPPSQCTLMQTTSLGLLDNIYLLMAPTESEQPDSLLVVNGVSIISLVKGFTCAFCKMLFTSKILRLEPMSFFTYGSRSIGKSWHSLSFTRSAEINAVISNFL